MLQGTTTVQLTDVATGAVETYESHNMITNAVAKFVKRYGNQDRVFERTDIPYTVLYGGLMIFDKNIPETPDTIFPPGETTMIGCGKYGVKNTYATEEMGDFNNDESNLVYNANEKYARMVWDFSTSKSNGTIGCICLTHKNAGIGGWGISKKTSYYSDSMVIGNTSNYMLLEQNERIFFVETETDKLYTYEIIDNAKVKIRTRPAGLKTISLFTYTGNGLIESEQEYNLQNTGSNTEVFCDIKNKILYVANWLHSTVTGGYKTVYKYTAIRFISGTSEVIELEDTVSDRNQCYFLVNDGIVYESRMENSIWKQYRFPLSQLESKTEIEGWTETFANISAYYRQIGDYLSFSGTNDITSSKMLNTKTLKTSHIGYKFANYYGGMAQSDDYFLDAGVRTDTKEFVVRKRCDYLATINNQTGIIKDDTKTMKIIYELREV